MNINSCILYFCKFTRKCPIVKPNNNSVFSFSSSRQDRKTGGIFFSKKIGKVNSFYRNDRYYPKMQVVGIKCSFFLNRKLSKNGGGWKYWYRHFRSTSCERWKDRTRHIPVWKSTSVGRWIAKPRWNLRSRQSISFLEEQ